MEQKKKALGRGLEQLFSSEVLDFETLESNIMEEATDASIKEIPLEEIRSNPYQPRKHFDQESLDELAESIRNYGVFQPIIVKKSIKGYDLVAGERRLRASKLAGLTTIPAIIKDFSDEEMREIALLENLQRENLTAIELAWAYKGIIDNHDIRQEDLAIKIGKSRSHVTNTLGLLRLPGEVQDMILDNKISMGHARVLSKLENDEQILHYAKRIAAGQMSVRELELVAAGAEVKKINATYRKPVNSNYNYIQKEIRETFGTKVRVNNKKIEIYFDNDSDLTRILDIMNIKIN